MDEIKIDKDIEIPFARNKAVKYPIADMKVGDSFFVKGIKSAGGFSGSLAKYRGMGWSFTSRQEGDGIRLWRIE